MGFVTHKQRRVLDVKNLPNTKSTGNPRYRITVWNHVLEKEESFNTEANAGWIYGINPHALIETYVDLQLTKPRKNLIICGITPSRFSTLSEYRAYCLGASDAYYGRDRFAEQRFNDAERVAYALGAEEEQDRKEYW